MSLSQTDTAILRIACPDQQGLVAAVTHFLAGNNGNILALDEYVDPDESTFFMRIAWALDGFAIPRDKIGNSFQTLLAEKYGMRWQLDFSRNRQKMALLVSHLPHCLHDLLGRWQADELAVDIPLVISNHETTRSAVENAGILFHHLPVSKENREETEATAITLLQDAGVDLIVLARYMQILSPDFVQKFPEKIINIHHSFLPAFPGARPYAQARQRGVKVIGATSHYVTEALDAGPIIDQDVTQVTHRESEADLVRKGRDLEKIVLSRSVRLHLEHRLMVHANRTIVFS